MTNVRAKVFEYASQLDQDGAVRSEDGAPVAVPAGWQPENILLAALLRCITASLRYYAEPKGIAVAVAGRAQGTVTLREDAGVFGLVEVDVDLDVTLDPLPAADDLKRLLARAKSGCFVSNSLVAAPSFRWRVNGAPVEVEAA